MDYKSGNCRKVEAGTCCFPASSTISSIRGEQLLLHIFFYFRHMLDDDDILQVNFEILFLSKQVF